MLYTIHIWANCFLYHLANNFFWTIMLLENRFSYHASVSRQVWWNDWWTHVIKKTISWRYDRLSLFHFLIIKFLIFLIGFILYHSFKLITLGEIIKSNNTVQWFLSWDHNLFSCINLLSFTMSRSFSIKSYSFMVQNVLSKFAYWHNVEY